MKCNHLDGVRIVPYAIPCQASLVEHIHPKSLQNSYITKSASFCHLVHSL